MKMPEKHDLLAAILAAKEQGIRAILAFAMAYLRGDNGGGYKTMMTQRCAPLSSFRLRPSRLLDCWQSRLCNGVFYIGYIGTDSIGSLIRRFAAKKKTRSRRW